MYFEGKGIDTDLLPVSYTHLDVYKRQVSYISDLEKVLVEFARVRKCDGVICGHIHHPANTYYDGIHYLNSGDWVAVSYTHLDVYKRQSIVRAVVAFFPQTPFKVQPKPLAVS